MTLGDRAESVESPSFSVIIPVRRLNPYVFDNVSKMQSCKTSKIEILVIVDEEEFHDWKDPRVKQIASGKILPGEKRDLAAKLAKNQYLVFIDDDAYISQDFFEIASKIITTHGFEIFGGPGVTPQNNSSFQKASGAVYESLFLSNVANRYRSIGTIKSVKDWPTVNLVVLKQTFDELGGFDNRFWPGEDSKFCMKIINSGRKIWYVPELIVFHHRRSTFFEHIKQSGNYGFYRGLFASNRDSNSTSPFFWLPTLFSLYLLLLVVAFLSTKGVNLLALSPLILYSCLVFFSSCEALFRWRTKAAIFVIFLIPSTHLVYGFRFAKGFFEDQESHSRQYGGHE